MDLGVRIAAERRALSGIACRLGVAAQDVDDVVSATMVRALELAGGYEEQGNLRAWLVAVMRRLILNGSRSAEKRRTVLVSFQDEADGHAVWREAAIAPAVQESAVAAAEALAVIEALPEDSRDIVQAITVGGLSYADYAAARGLSMGTVKSRLSRALTEVRARLADVTDAEALPAPPASSSSSSSCASSSRSSGIGSGSPARTSRDARVPLADAKAMPRGGTATRQPQNIGTPEHGSGAVRAAVEGGATEPPLPGGSAVAKEHRTENALDRGCAALSPQRQPDRRAARESRKFGATARQRRSDAINGGDRNGPNAATAVEAGLPSSATCLRHTNANAACPAPRSISAHDVRPEAGAHRSATQAPFESRRPAPQDAADRSHAAECGAATANLAVAVAAPGPCRAAATADHGSGVAAYRGAADPARPQDGEAAEQEQSPLPTFTLAA